MSTATQTARLLSIDTPAGEDVLLISGFTAMERLSGLFEIDVELIADRTNASSVNSDELIGQPVTIKVATGTDFENGPFRYFNGIVSRFTQGGRDERYVHYQMELVPWTWLLTRKSNCRIFQDKSVLEIVKEVFDDLKGDFSFVAYEDKTQASYTKLDYCVQHREMDFNFVSRLMEQDGIYYYFKHSEDGHTLVLADSVQACEDCPHQSTVRYEPEGGTDESENDTIESWRKEEQLYPGKYVLRDHQFQMFDKTLEVSETSLNQVGGNSNLEMYDYLGEYAQRFNKPDERMGTVESEGQKLVKLRMEQEETPHLETAGSSNCRTLIAGFTFTLSEHFSDDGEYLLKSVQHSAIQSPSYHSGEHVSSAPYHNSFICIPKESTYRSPRVTPKPVVQGLQSAVVVGPSGEEIHTDKYGRIRVQFHWDREGENDEKCTCWVRVSQSMAGTQWGAHFWPRIGHEVLVAFIEGDPDQPVIVGSLYNDVNMPPYELPQHQTRSGFKTRSSKDGNNKNFNEIRFEDKKGEEEIYFHAEKNFNRVVENNDTLKVGFDKSSDGDQTIEIHNNQDVTIGNAQSKDGSQTVEIWKDQNHTLKQGNREAIIEMGKDSLTIKMGNQTTKLDLGKSSTEAMQSIEFKVGGNSIKIDQSGITIKGILIKIEGIGMAEMKSPMTTVKGDGMLTLKGGLTMIN